MLQRGPEGHNDSQGQPQYLRDNLAFFSIQIQQDRRIQIDQKKWIFGAYVVHGFFRSFTGFLGRSRFFHGSFTVPFFLDCHSEVWSMLAPFHCHMCVL